MSSNLKYMLHTVDSLTSIVRFIVGLILMVVAMRAYIRTRIPAMLFLTVGFTLITVGNLFSTIYYIEDARMDKLLSNIFDILGLVSLIIAVNKG